MQEPQQMARERSNAEVHTTSEIRNGSERSSKGQSITMALRLNYSAIDCKFGEKSLNVIYLSHMSAFTAGKALGQFMSDS